MALEEDLIARPAVVLAAEEVVEADFVESGGAGICREVAAESGRSIVSPQDHGHRIPANQPPDAPLEILVAREERLILGADGVDVTGLG